MRKSAAGTRINVCVRLRPIIASEEESGYKSAPWQVVGDQFIADAEESEQRGYKFGKQLRLIRSC